MNEETEYDVGKLIAIFGKECRIHITDFELPENYDFKADAKELADVLAKSLPAITFAELARLLVEE